jgi:hypothetical protein
MTMNDLEGRTLTVGSINNNNKIVINLRFVVVVVLFILNSLISSFLFNSVVTIYCAI